MRVRESILIIVGVGLLSSTIYLVLDGEKMNKENEKLNKEFTSYKEKAQEEKKAQVQNKEHLKKEKLHLDVRVKVENAYALAQSLQKKYKKKCNTKSIIVEALNQSGVYVKNYNGNQVGDINSSYLVDGLRAIELEEIQKVRRHKEGYIEVKSKESHAEQYIYVKNLEMYQLFIGASAIFR